MMTAMTAAASSVHMMNVDGERRMREAGGRAPHTRGVRKSESVSHDSFPAPPAWSVGLGTALF